MKRSEACFQERKVKNHYFSLSCLKTPPLLRFMPSGYINLHPSPHLLSTTLPINPLYLLHLGHNRLSSPDSSILNHFTIHTEDSFNKRASQYLVILSFTNLHLCCTSATHTDRPTKSSTSDNLTPIFYFLTTTSFFF